MKEFARLYFWLSFSPWFLYITLGMAGWFNRSTAPYVFIMSLIFSGLGFLLLIFAKIFKHKELIKPLAQGTGISFSFIILMLVLNS